MYKTFTMFITTTNNDNTNNNNIIIIIIIILINSQQAALRGAPSSSDKGDTSPHEHSRKEPVRFDSFRFWTFRKLIGSVRFFSEN